MENKNQFLTAKNRLYGSNVIHQNVTLCQINEFFGKFDYLLDYNSFPFEWALRQKEKAKLHGNGALKVKLQK